MFPFLNVPRQSRTFPAPSISAELNNAPAPRPSTFDTHAINGTAKEGEKGPWKGNRSKWRLTSQIAKTVEFSHTRAAPRPPSDLRLWTLGCLAPFPIYSNLFGGDIPPSEPDSHSLRLSVFALTKSPHHIIKQNSLSLFSHSTILDHNLKSI
jgi:hypothetical protein